MPHEVFSPQNRASALFFVLHCRHAANQLSWHVPHDTPDSSLLLSWELRHTIWEPLGYTIVKIKAFLKCKHYTFAHAFDLNNLSIMLWYLLLKELWNAGSCFDWSAQSVPIVSSSQMPQIFVSHVWWSKAKQLLHVAHSRGDVISWSIFGCHLSKWALAHSIIFTLFQVQELLWPTVRLFNPAVVLLWLSTFALITVTAKLQFCYCKIAVLTWYSLDSEWHPVIKRLLAPKQNFLLLHTVLRQRGLVSFHHPAHSASYWNHKHPNPN